MLFLVFFPSLVLRQGTLSVVTSFLLQDYDLEKKMYQLSEIKFGPYEMDTWYSSPFPPEYTMLRKIYICEFCLKYYRSLVTISRHEVREDTPE